MNPNSLLAQWADGFLVVTDSAAVTAAGGLVRRAFFSIPDAQTEEGARALATKELARLQGGESIVAEPVVTVGDATAPYAGWFVGDSIPVTQFDGTGTDTVEVTGITVTEDDNGVVSATPELQSPLQVRAERMATQLRRAQPGITSNVASISMGMDRNSRGGSVATEELTWGFDGQLLDKSPPMRFRRRVRATFWDLTLTVPGSTSTALQILKNGTAVSGFSQNNVTGLSSCLFVPGVHHVACLIDNEVFTEFDEVVFDVTVAGTGAETLSCQLLAAVSEV